MSAGRRLAVAATIAVASAALVTACSGGASADSTAGPAAAPAPAGAAATGGRVAAGSPAATRSSRLRIHKWLIPYGPGRKRDMARYSKRHYGRFRWRLRRPKLIVEHFAVAGSVASIHRTFAPNRRDPEFGELPGVCSHFAVSATGRAYKFVPTSIRCRHVVGLNHVAIGIEHVGFSDGQVMGRGPELRSSLRLTRQLRCRFGIPVRNVIGHNESLASPFYKELDPDFRGQTHGDFARRTMRVYRARLARLGAC